MQLPSIGRRRPSARRSACGPRSPKICATIAALKAPPNVENHRVTTNHDCTPLFATLSDDQLLAETKRLVANERAATAALLRSLMEIDSRRLYLREGCSSLFTYCTQVLHLAEGAAYNRIEAARVGAAISSGARGAADGSLTLTSVRLLAPHFTEDNHRSCSRRRITRASARWSC